MCSNEDVRSIPENSLGVVAIFGGTDYWLFHQMGITQYVGISWYKSLELFFFLMKEIRSGRYSRNNFCL